MKRASALSLSYIWGVVVIAVGMGASGEAVAANPCIQAGAPVFVGCVNDGSINGTAWVTASLVCLGEAIPFTLHGSLSDSGGTKRMRQSYVQSYCPPKEYDVIVSGNVEYTWVVWSGGQVVASGSGRSASYTPATEGTYTCEFTAKVSRSCPPGSRIFATSAQAMKPTITGPNEIKALASKSITVSPSAEWSGWNEGTPFYGIDAASPNSPRLLPVKDFATQLQITISALCTVQGAVCSAEKTITIGPNGSVSGNVSMGSPPQAPPFALVTCYNTLGGMLGVGGVGTLNGAYEKGGVRSGPGRVVAEYQAGSDHWWGFTAVEIEPGATATANVTMNLLP